MECTPLHNYLLFG